MRDHESREVDLAYLTECCLGTVESLLLKSRTPRSVLERHQHIAEFAVRMCRRYDVTVEHAKRGRCVRLRKLLEEE